MTYFNLYIPASKTRGRAHITCASLKVASQAYCTIRDETGEGGSTFPDGRIVSDDGDVYRVSYNGRIWDNKPWSADDKPVYDNR